MEKMKVLFRQIQEVPASKWQKKLELEEKMIQAEAQAGYPVPRCYRPLFGSEHAEMTRVYERIFDSYTDFGHLISIREQNPILVALDKENDQIIKSERNELFYVDSGSPVPRWMQAISTVKFSPEELKCPVKFHPIQIPSEERKVQNIKEGKMRVVYRLTQEIPRHKWAEKFDQERRSDEIEIKTGAPLPIRYRAMFAGDLSQVRINEREYESWTQFCQGMEAFLDAKDVENQACMDAEIRRQSFFNWEREEIYVVDSDSYTPLWMKYASEEVSE